MRLVLDVVGSTLSAVGIVALLTMLWIGRSHAAMTSRNSAMN